MKRLIKIEEDTWNRIVKQAELLNEEPYELADQIMKLGLHDLSSRSYDKYRVPPVRSDDQEFE